MFTAAIRMHVARSLGLSACERCLNGVNDQLSVQNSNASLRGSVRRHYGDFRKATSYRIQIVAV